MIEGQSPVVQAALGTLLTWGLTAAGSALVFVFSSTQRKVLDGSLGFAAGVMTAASYWSLLDPALETAKESQYYGVDGEFAFVPVAIGFIAGAAFVYAADKFLPALDPASMLSLNSRIKPDKNFPALLTPPNGCLYDFDLASTSPVIIASQTTSSSSVLSSQTSTSSSSHYTNALQFDFRGARRRGGSRQDLNVDVSNDDDNDDDYDKYRKPVDDEMTKQISWRRITLLILAIVVHNIPEGLAVGVGFGAVGKSASATFASARSLAIGIGIQNFPEGLAVSLPLRGTGMSTWKSFWYGQLSGMVEPIAGIIGAAAVVIAEPLLPYTLAFAAGAMIYVVVDDIIPEAHTHGNGRLASICSIVGFVVMMSLDVGLG